MKKDIKETKEKIIASLENKIYIKAVYRISGSEERIRVLFEFNGQQAEFEYTLIGQEIGIDSCSYKEKDDEDIYGLIHDWVDENIETETKVLCGNKKVEYEGYKI